MTLDEDTSLQPPRITGTRIVQTYEQIYPSIAEKSSQQRRGERLRPLVGESAMKAQPSMAMTVVHLHKRK